jgi:hypothetical protein
MKELKIEEMASLRGGLLGLNSSNIFANLAGNAASAFATNLVTNSNNAIGASAAPSTSTVTQTPTASAGTITLTQTAGSSVPTTTITL